MFNELKKCSGDIIYYHHICHTEFSKKSKSSDRKSVPTGWHIRQNLYQNVSEVISSSIGNNLISRVCGYFLSYLHKLYFDMIQKLDDES